VSVSVGVEESTMLMSLRLSVPQSLSLKSGSVRFLLDRGAGGGVRCAHRPLASVLQISAAICLAANSIFVFLYPL
jgi:hypothetical protein